MVVWLVHYGNKKQSTDADRWFHLLQFLLQPTFSQPTNAINQWYNDNTLMMTLGESATNSTKRSFFTLFIPLFHPKSRANGRGQLTHGLALVFIRLLSTENPLIVTIPAMHGLIVGRETFVTGRGANIFDLIQTGHFLLVEFGRGRRENLIIITSFKKSRAFLPTVSVLYCFIQFQAQGKERGQ